MLDGRRNDCSAEGWTDKLAAGVTVATYPSGDKLSSLMQMVVFATQHGMIWVGLDDIGAPVNPDEEGVNEDGFSLGLGATSVRDKARMIPLQYRKGLPERARQS